MKYRLLSILSFLIICGCDDIPVNQKDSIIKKYWNFIPDTNNEKLQEFKDQPLYFSNSKVIFYNKTLANYFLDGKSIIVSDTFYLDKINALNAGENRNGAKRNVEFFKEIKDDSLYRIIDTYLIGEIEKSTKDSLTINKFEGYGLPFKFQKRFSFYNDSLQIDESIKLDSIQFSKSTCFGNCPNYAIKISKSGEVKFWGGKYFDPRGFHKSKISNDNYSKIENLVKISNIEGNDIIDVIQADASTFDLIIYVNNQQPKRFKGLLDSYPLRIQNIGGYINGIVDEITFEKTKLSFDFQVELDSMEF